ncbi:MAG: recombinase family protein [Rhodobacteraceae bacterium]|nr:recombinase family protein [Paracoccaceae bacterium]
MSFPVVGQPAFGQVLWHLPVILAPAFHDPGAAQDGAGIVVIIDDISRFARHIESHWTLRGTPKDLGGKLESPSIKFGEDSDSVLIENMLVSVSRHQRQKNAEQTRNRMRARAMSGYWCYGDARVFVARRHAAVAPVAAGADHAGDLSPHSRPDQRGRTLHLSQGPQSRLSAP